MQNHTTVSSSNVKSLRILFVTDIHLQNQNIQLLRKWHLSNMLNFDLILCGGDTANCNQNDKTHNEEQMEKQTNALFKKIHDIFGRKIYYIPGNHDPLSYYVPGHNITSNIQSCHQRVIEIEQNLQLVGFGGSVPGYFDKDFKDQAWKGYPFYSNEQLQSDVCDKKVFEDLNQKTQKIILTHVGPYDSDTTVSKRNYDKPIFSGATYFNSLLKRKDLVLYLHGHTHDGGKFAKANGIPIINPGAILQGQFGYILLEQVNSNKKWVLKQTHFHRLEQTDKLDQDKKE